ncbi:hypothetical protein LJK88_29565 [Paenibacillus sp. P26]|nr:hypothetical protein LJK88_29565 [Paenibacillus sp. P26]
MEAKLLFPCRPSMNIGSIAFGIFCPSAPEEPFMMVPLESTSHTMPLMLREMSRVPKRSSRVDIVPSW